MNFYHIEASGLNRDAAHFNFRSKVFGWPFSLILAKTSLMQKLVICILASLAFLALPTLSYCQSYNYNDLRSTRWSGPRVGITYITGKTADRLRDDFDAAPFVTQFGWQFERNFFSMENGPTGVVELIPLIGGVEQGLFLPSLTFAVGLRTNSGFEFGAGPNLSLTGAGLALAVGKNIPSGKLNFPINFSVVTSKQGARFSLIFGFNSAN